MMVVMMLKRLRWRTLTLRRRWATTDFGSPTTDSHCVSPLDLLYGVVICTPTEKFVSNAYHGHKAE